MRIQFLFLSFFFACSSLFSQNEQESPYMNAFVVIADSSLVYKDIEAKMHSLKDKLNIEIDTLGRSYNKKKNLIALPEDDEDEIYAGDYFPRRFPSQSLSLEYLDSYDTNATAKNIVLVVGIFYEKEKAKVLLEKLQEFSPYAYILNTDIYMGCMH